MKIKNLTDRKLKVVLLSKTNTEEPDNLTMELEPRQIKDTEEFPADWIEITEHFKKGNSLDSL